MRNFNQNCKQNVFPCLDPTTDIIRIQIYENTKLFSTTSFCTKFKKNQLIKGVI